MKKLKKFKKKYNKFKTKNRVLNTTGALIVIGSTSASITLTITGFDLFVVPLIASVGCRVANTIKLASDMKLNVSFL